MAVATVGPVSTGPLFAGKVMNIQLHHAINTLLRAHAINLRRRRGRRVEVRVDGSEGAARRSLYKRSPMSSIIPRQGSIFRTIVRGIKSNVVLCAESLVQ